jgi:hypothetical protein
MMRKVYFAFDAHAAQRLPAMRTLSFMLNVLAGKRLFPSAKVLSR